MRLSPALALSLFFLCSPAGAQAEPFTVLPDGSLVFHAQLSTQATFRCREPSFLPVPCLDSVPGQVVLGSGADTLTLTFTGRDTAITVGNILVPVTVGTIESSVTGGGITYPSPPNRNAWLVGLDFSMTQSAPQPAGPVGFSWFFGPGNGTVLPLLEAVFNYAAFPTGPNPPGYEYTDIVYTVPHFNIPGFTGTVDVTAQAGVVPEPATLLLVGSGLVGAAFARRRKRMSIRDEAERRV